MPRSDSSDLRAEIARLEAENRTLRERAARDAQPAQGDASEHLDTLFVTIPHLFFVIAADDTFVAYRAGGNADLFVPPENFMGHPVNAVLPEGVAEKVLDGIRRTRATGRRSSVEYVLPIRGEDKHFEAWFVLLSDGRVGAMVIETTERVVAAAAGREREALLHTIFEAEPECVKVVSPEGQLLEMNPAGLAMLEVDSVSEASSLLDFIWPEDRPAFANLHRQVMNGETMRLAFRITGRRGTERWLETTATPLRGAAGAITALLGVTRDITEHRRVEEALLASTKRLQSIADTMPIPVLITRLSDGKILYANGPLCELAELPSSALLGCSIADFYADPSDRHQLRLMLQRSGMIHDFEVRARSASGSVFWVSFSARRTTWDGEPAVLAGLIDLSDRKRAEHELRSSEELHRALFEANPFPMWAYDIETLRFLAVNDAAVWHYGYSRDEFMAMSVRGILPPEELQRFETFLERSSENPGTFTTQTRHITKNGVRIRVESTSASVLFQGRPARMVTIHDITERMRLEDELRRAQKLEGIGRLAGGVAHDFNNLLTAILGYTQLLEARMAREPDVLADLEEIRRAGVRARDLTQQLLAVARRQVSAPRVLDVNTLATAMERLLRRLLGEHIDFVTHFVDGVWPIKADPAQVEQILMNLAVNARDAMQNGGTLTITTANVTLGDAGEPLQPGLAPGSYVMLEVRDTGIGMSRDTLSHVFEPFFSTKPVGQGTGLGLATVYGIMKQCGGQVWVHSELGDGATFRLYFPRSQEPYPEPPPENDASAPGGCETVLVVEDDPAVRALAVRALEQAGYAVAAATRGDEALEIARGMKKPIQLLVTDVVMPILSGHEVAQRLAATRPDMRVLYMSGYAPDSVMPAEVIEGGAQFLPKPFTASILLQKVRALLDAHVVR